MNRHFVPVFASVAMLALACGSNSIGINNGDNASAVLTGGDMNKDSTDDFDVVIEPQSSSVPVPGATEYDVKYLITVANRTQVPMTITRIALQSIGQATGSELPLRVRSFKTALGAKDSAKVEFWATISLASQNAAFPNVLRAQIDFESADAGKRRESFIRNVGGRVSVGARSRP